MEFRNKCIKECILDIEHLQASFLKNHWIELPPLDPLHVETCTTATCILTAIHSAALSTHTIISEINRRLFC